jgi:hypothetical protein
MKLTVKVKSLSGAKSVINPTRLGRKVGDVSRGNQKTKQAFPNALANGIGSAVVAPRRLNPLKVKAKDMSIYT